MIKLYSCIELPNRSVDKDGNYSPIRLNNSTKYSENAVHIQCQCEQENYYTCREDE